MERLKLWNILLWFWLIGGLRSSCCPCRSVIVIMFQTRMTEERIGLLQHSVLSSFFITLTNTGYSYITSATNLELFKILVLSAAILNFMQINLIFPRSFWWGRGNIFDGSTTKVNSYIEKRVHTKIGACIRPVTILTLSDLTSKGIFINFL